MRISLVAQMVKRLPTMRETQVRSLGQEDPLEKEMASTPILLPGKSHGWRSLVGYSPWGHKESQRTNQGDNTFKYLHTNHQSSQLYEANIDRTERKRGNNIIVVDFSAPLSIMD